MLEEDSGIVSPEHLFISKKLDSSKSPVLYTCYDYGAKALMGITGNAPRRRGRALCRMDADSQGFAPGCTVSCSVLLRANLHLFSATSTTIHCRQDTRRRRKKESVNLVLPGVRGEHRP